MDRHGYFPGRPVRGIRANDSWVHADHRLSGVASDGGTVGGPKKKHAGFADLAAWYGINPYAISGEQRAGLSANLPRVKAQRQLFEGRLEGYDEHSIYDLMMIAYDNPQAAQAAQTAFLQKKVEAECAAATQNQR